jgi:hypothetical protein
VNRRRRAKATRETGIEIARQLRRSRASSCRQYPHYEPTAGRQRGKPGGDDVPQLTADPIANNGTPDCSGDHKPSLLIASHATSFSEREMDDEPGS